MYIYISIYIHMYIYIYIYIYISNLCLLVFLDTEQRKSTACWLQCTVKLLRCGRSHALNKDKLQYIATYCNMLQHAATYFNILQHTATYCNILQYSATQSKKYIALDPVHSRHCKHALWPAFELPAQSCHSFQGVCCVCVCVHVCVCACVRVFVCVCLLQMNLCVFACLRVCMCACVHVCVCVYVCVCVESIFVSVHVCVCMCAAKVHGSMRSNSHRAYRPRIQKLYLKRHKLLFCRGFSPVEAGSLI